jgi:peptidoglycan-associated lipoprotein
MKIQSLSRVVLFGALLLSLGAVGCAKKKNLKSDADSTEASSSSVDTADVNSGAATSDNDNAMGLRTIHFPYNSFEIVGENKEALQNDIKILNDNPSVKIQIEGHCDDRGGIQYNLALGEKRANAVSRMISAGGVAKSRITTISMGKEKPIAQGTGEAVWAQNRRANFVITDK